MSPKDLIDRLAHLAETARHHPEPGVAVETLAVLVLELARQLAPLTARFSILLHATGFPPESLEDLVAESQKNLEELGVNPAELTSEDDLVVDQVEPTPAA